MLEEAWGIGEVPPALKARIARDRAALALLEGKLEEAEEWYGRAAAIAPEEAPSGLPAEALRATRPRKSSP